MSKELTFEMLVPETLLNWRRRALEAEARAQHMGELVEAAKEICEMQSNHFGDGMATHRKLVTHCARLRAILAKIGGGE